MEEPGAQSEEAVKGHTPRRWGPREERAWFTLSPRTTLWIKTGRTPASVEAEKPDCTSRHVWTLLTGLGFLKKLVELPGGQSRTLVQASAHGTTKKEVGRRAGLKIDPNSHMTPQPLHLPKATPSFPFCRPRAPPTRLSCSLS